MFTALLKCCICYKSRQKRKLKSLYCLLFNRHLLLQLYRVTSQRGSMREVTESRSPKTPHLMQKNTQPTQSPSKPGALQFTRCSSDHLAEEAAHNAHASKSLQTRHTTELTLKVSIMRLSLGFSCNKVESKFPCLSTDGLWHRNLLDVC